VTAIFSDESQSDVKENTTEVCVLNNADSGACQKGEMDILISHENKLSSTYSTNLETDQLMTKESLSSE